MNYTYQYPMQTVTADAVVFCRHEVLLIKRNTEPFKGQWALPGGHLDPEDENTEVTADRELKEETGVDADDQNVFIQGEVGAYSQIDRDPRGRYITIAYFYCMLEKPECKIDPEEVKEVKWFNIYDLKEDEVAFDHYKIIMDADVKATKIMLSAPTSINSTIKKWGNILGKDLGVKCVVKDYEK